MNVTGDTKIEEEIKEKSLSGPRVTPEHIQAVIKDVGFLVPDGSSLTICIATLLNGYQVTGESACADPDNFDAELGRQAAYNKAYDKVWALEGYLLKQSLYQRSLMAGPRDVPDVDEPTAEQVRLFEEERQMELPLDTPTQP